MPKIPDDRSATHHRDNEPVLLTRAELRELARGVAEETVHEVFTQMGVDVTNPIEVQADMLYLRQLRASSGKLRWSVIGSIVTVAISGAALAIWAGLKHMIKN